MRLRLLAAAVLTAPAVLSSPAGAAYPIGGSCTVVHPYASTCGNAILCAPGSVVTVAVAGLGYGSASCGGAHVGGSTAYAMAAVASSSGFLTCAVDPAGLGVVAVTCTVTPGIAQ